MRLTFQASGKFDAGSFIPASHRRVSVEVRDGERVVDRFQVSSDKPRSRSQATKYGPTDTEVIAACDETLASGRPFSWDAPAPEPTLPAGNTVFVVREFEATSGETTQGPTADTLKQLVEATPVERLVTWKDREEACCLDIDYHLTHPPVASHLEAVIETRLYPRPLFWHFSRGGGAHCFYVRSGNLTAEELAAAAALRFRTVDPSAGLDLVTHVRGAGAPVRDSGGGVLGAEGCLPGVQEVEAGDEAVSDWLDTHGLAIGGRYDHEKCPIDPCPGPKNQPVTVSEYGVHCFRCAAKGLSLGSRKPGFASFTALTGTPGSGDVALMVRNKVHWGHAKWVLTEKYELPESLARLGYTAALKLLHDIAEDELAAVFSPETDALARNNDSWTNILSGGYIYPTVQSIALVGSLPGCMARDEKGRLRGVPSKVSFFCQGHDLTERGYGNLSVVHGARLARQFLPPSKEAQVAVLAKDLRGSPRAPQYRRRSERKTVSWAEGVFERYFPGLCWTAVRSQVCAAGVAQETRLGLHPMTFLSGPSGAAKTTTVKLAAGILGSAAPEVSYHRDEEKMKRGISEAGRRGAFALCNEFLKDHQRMNNNRFDPRAALETVLTLTPEVQIHVMYVGSRPLGRLPAVVFTEPRCPYMLRDYRQISRRVRTVQLFGAKEAWRESLAALNLTPDTIHLYRLRDAELAEAADVILSDLIDNYFAVPMTWDAIADSLCCPTIENSPEFDDPKPAMREFFELVCTAPELTDPRLQKKYSSGYKRIDRNSIENGDTALLDIWNQFCKGPNAEWFQSSVLEEADWSGLIGSKHDVRLDLKGDGVGSVYVRFRVGPVKNPTYINDTIPREQS